MRCPRSSARLLFVLLFLVATLLAPTPRAFAQQLSVLYSFNPGIRDGLFPEASLIFDASGNLYGTTFGGGVDGCFGSTSNCGTAFELSRAADVGWTEKTIHNFGKGSDGLNPTAGMIFDAAGNLYGATSMGGAYGFGTVFELSPTADGSWAEKVLHHFNYNGADGINPYAGLTIDASGNLYGTTAGGGVFNGGTVFELTPTVNGSWSEKVLHSFAFNGRDGVNPWAELSMDTFGNLYSTTSSGGVYGWGTVFELSPAAGGSWTEKTLHNFNYNGKDGVQTYSGLSFDGHGNLYGTTPGGGAHGYGTVFELIPGAGGNWTEKILHNFNSNGKDGTEPAAAVIVDTSGNVYGTTLSGGISNGGTVFKLSPAAGGNWTEKILHNFSGNDGERPEGSVIVDAAGNAYGTTNLGGAFGGAFGYGTVFEITP